MSRELQRAIALRRWVRVALERSDIVRIAELCCRAERAVAALNPEEMQSYVRWAYKKPTGGNG